MKLLLHICCAPCAIYPLRRLKESGHSVSGVFYNPNVHPYGEYKLRRRAAEDFALRAGLELFIPEYQPTEFFRAVNMKENSPQRCVICWSLRLEQAARCAKDKLFDAFTTTLLVSPYQSQEMIKKLGEEAEKDAGVRFYYEDFRPGFAKAHEEARATGLYCQKYCGCVYSDIERSARRKR